MLDDVIRCVQQSQRALLALFNGAPAAWSNTSVLQESALKLIHSYDSLIQCIDPLIKSGPNGLLPVSPTRRLHDDHMNDDPQGFSEEVVQLLNEVASTACSLKATVFKHLMNVEIDVTPLLDGSAFSPLANLPLLGAPNEDGSPSGPPRRIAFDIGGTLIKLAYCCESSDCDALYTIYWAQRAVHDTVRCLERHCQVDLLSGCSLGRNLRRLAPAMIRLGKSTVIRFQKFPVDSLSSVLNDLTANKVVAGGTVINLTGGGAYKFAHVFEERLPHCEFRKIPEMACVVTGTEAMHGVNSCFASYDLRNGHAEPTTAKKSYPYLTVNIGSGISILKVSSETSFERVTGTSLGGGTMHGLTNILLGLNGHDELPMLYDNGTNCMDTFIPEASESRPPPYGLKASRENAARSTSDMISYNIGLIAFLVAKTHGVKRVIFTGSYTVNAPMTMDVAAAGVAYMAQCYQEETMDTMVPVFGAYAGVLGCLLTP
ncbi:fumble protein [Babesia caballi]|uniref:Fumble protein n=1 Tax=Babesia caballi TaxID=5871 RepID=A0AAV4LZ48_BABCB|nr:fumble protein [Babesia caballi]